jgi:hypothetical protein
VLKYGSKLLSIVLSEGNVIKKYPSNLLSFDNNYEGDIALKQRMTVVTG